MATEEELKKAILKDTRGGEGRMDKVAGLFRGCYQEEETYKKFVNSVKPDEESQKAVIKL